MNRAQPVTPDHVERIIGGDRAERFIRRLWAVDLDRYTADEIVNFRELANACCAACIRWGWTKEAASIYDGIQRMDAALRRRWTPECPCGRPPAKPCDAALSRIVTSTGYRIGRWCPHRVGGEGGQVGPDIAKRKLKNPDALPLVDVGREKCPGCGEQRVLEEHHHAPKDRNGEAANARPTVATGSRSSGNSSSCATPAESVASRRGPLGRPPSGSLAAPARGGAIVGRLPAGTAAFFKGFPIFFALL
jgi:hypothetical protein